MWAVVRHCVRDHQAIKPTKRVPRQLRLWPAYGALSFLFELQTRFAPKAVKELGSRGYRVRETTVSVIYVSSFHPLTSRYEANVLPRKYLP